MNYLFAGDCHGDLDYVVKLCAIAEQHDATILQVGDWGFLCPAGNQVKQLSSVLKAHRVTMRFIDGNHDWHPELAALSGYARYAVEIQPNVIYQPRGSEYTDPDGTKFVFMGGAPSIDKSYRREGVSWWPEEVITPADMSYGLYHGKADVLVTHDAHDYPPGFAPKGDPAFRAQSKRSLSDIKKLRTTLNPRLHVHGHWHFAYVDGVTRGIDCNYAARFADSYYLWDSNEPSQNT